MVCDVKRAGWPALFVNDGWVHQTGEAPACLGIGVFTAARWGFGTPLNQHSWPPSWPLSLLPDRSRCPPLPLPLPCPQAWRSRLAWPAACGACSTLRRPGRLPRCCTRRPRSRSSSPLRCPCSQARLALAFSPAFCARQGRTSCGRVRPEPLGCSATPPPAVSKGGALGGATVVSEFRPCSNDEIGEHIPHIGIPSFIGATPRLCRTQPHAVCARGVIAAPLNRRNHDTHASQPRFAARRRARRQGRHGWLLLRPAEGAGRACPGATRAPSAERRLAAGWQDAAAAVGAAPRGAAAPAALLGASTKPQGRAPRAGDTNSRRRDGAAGGRGSWVGRRRGLQHKSWEQCQPQGAGHSPFARCLPRVVNWLADATPLQLDPSGRRLVPTAESPHASSAWSTAPSSPASLPWSACAFGQVGWVQQLQACQRISLNVSRHAALACSSLNPPTASLPLTVSFFPSPAAHRNALRSSAASRWARCSEWAPTAKSTAAAGEGARWPSRCARCRLPRRCSASPAVLGCPCQKVPVLGCVLRHLHLPAP